MFAPSMLSHDPDSARIAALMESMPVGFILWDADWLCTGVNAEGERLCGKVAAQLFGRSLWQLFPEVVGTDFESVYRRVAATGRADRVEIFYPDPLNRWLEIHLSGHDGGVAAFYVDVTARHRIQDGLDRLAAHDRTVAQTLQNVLLPTLPTIEGVELAARYLTAQDNDQVGGDWYDVVPGAGGSLSVLIGDVAGHDIDAAATMGQLRSMLRMSAWDHAEDDPSQLITRLDRAMRALGIRTTASLALVKFESSSGQGRTNGVASRTVLLTNAGHPPPVVVEPDGSTRLLTTRPDVLLGVDPWVLRHDHRFDVALGSIVILYTDGLVETRTHDLDDGVRRLQAALEKHHGEEPGPLLDLVIDELVGTRPDDDVAVIAARIA